MKLKLVKFPHPALVRTCAPVNKFDDELRDHVIQMAQIATDRDGVGLAAPQVDLDLRLLWTVYAGVMCNPRMMVNGGPRDDADEGCLSLPGVIRTVRRWQEIFVSWSDLAGMIHNGQFSGIEARVIQHEIDHLDGILITDKPRVPFARK